MTMTNKIPNLQLKSVKKKPLLTNCDSQCYQSVDWTFIQVYHEQLEAGSVSKLVGRYFWDKNVCCVLLPQHHVMIYLLMSKHRMSNDGMPFQRYNHTN